MIGGWKPRRSVRVAAQLAVEIKSGDRVIEATATDLNEHGLFVRTSESIAAGLAVQILLKLPSGTVSIEGQPRFMGHTIWGQGVGIEFILSDDEASAIWLRYVRSFSSAPVS